MATIASLTTKESHTKVIEKYLQEADEPTLNEFLNKNISLLAEGGSDFKQYWIDLYKTVTAQSSVRFVAGRVDWYEVLVDVGKSSVVGCSSAAVLPALPAAESTTTYPKTPNSSSSTKPFIQKMETAHAAIKNNKWILPSGTIVEDEMLAYCCTLDYEHAGHSFVLDHHDKPKLFNAGEI
ncbi:hypothetical protein BDB00DRAFT_867436 [Zychaea mexicana]|uniref:uncharacterized protein n=1 Tax=Zychaea mexicana TaxID=64656 RepID=UPI0022FECF37|nr:uncharacterized protein BDB00DRAFT_867436 [Zychaea mexicana]KAI9498822.1 hypothetical protein BDB00DRAFT_867436 [Zychaea mexicana]